MMTPDQKPGEQAYSRLVRRQSFAKMHIRNDIDAVFDVTEQKNKTTKLVKIPNKMDKSE